MVTKILESPESERIEKAIVDIQESEEEEEVQDGEATGKPVEGTEVIVVKLTISSENAAANGTATKKKKKKKPKKPKQKGLKQSDPPRIPVSRFFPDGNYPEGETHEYKEYVQSLTHGANALDGPLLIHLLFV